MNKIMKYWNLYELAWLLVFSGVAVFLTVYYRDSFFGFSVTLTGMLCVVLAAKGNIFTYPVGVYNTVGYAWLAWQNGLFGEVGLNLLFFMPMNVAGFFLWKNHVEGGSVRMLRLRRRTAVLVGAGSLLSILLLGFGLSLLEGQNSPYIDASTNVLSVVATLLMVRRYREQWFCYIALNILSVIMWSLRTLSGSPEGPIMVVMWSAYLINAFYGLYNWTKGARAGEAAA